MKETYNLLNSENNNNNLLMIKKYRMHGNNLCNHAGYSQTGGSKIMGHGKVLVISVMVLGLLGFAIKKVLKAG